MAGQGMNFGRIGVLAGGPSSEREISLRSGKAVFEALKGRGLDVVLLDIAADARDAILDSGIDLAFIALHGRFGEDGTVQRMLEEMKMPYTGSGARASKLAIDKIESKKVFIESGIPVPRYVALEKDDVRLGIAVGLGMPLVVKPYLEGSSIGLSVVRREEEFGDAVEAAFAYGARVLVEEYIKGRELTVGILDDEPLPVIEIVPKDSVYDYKAKYSDPDTRYLVPAPIDSDTCAYAQALAKRAHKALGCRCFSRVDMMLDGSGKMFVLEANTIPGMTARSLLPKAAMASGLSFENLCVRLVEDALARFKE